MLSRTFNNLTAGLISDTNKHLAGFATERIIRHDGKFYDLLKLSDEVATH